MLISRRALVRFHVGLPIFLNVVVYQHCLVIAPKAYAVACLNTKIIWLVHHELRLATGLSINKHFSFVDSVAWVFVVVVCFCIDVVLGYC